MSDIKKLITEGQPYEVTEDSNVCEVSLLNKVKAQVYGLAITDSIRKD